MIGTASHLHKMTTYGNKVVIPFSAFQITGDNWTDGIALILSREEFNDLREKMKAFRVDEGMGAVRKELGK